MWLKKYIGLPIFKKKPIGRYGPQKISWNHSLLCRGLRIPRPSWYLFALWKKMIPDPRVKWIIEGAGGTTEEAHQERFFSSVDGSRWRFFTWLCTIQLVFLASQSVVDQQPICWAGQPTETSTRVFIKPQKQRSTMFLLTRKTLRQGLSGGGAGQSKKIKES